MGELRAEGWRRAGVEGGWSFATLGEGLNGKKMVNRKADGVKE